MVYAHLQSPRKAYLGEGTEAVNTAKDGFGAVAAPVYAAAFGPSGTAHYANSVRVGSHKSILIRNYSKYHVEIEQVPVEYGDISVGQGIYCDSPRQCQKLEA